MLVRRLGSPTLGQWTAGELGAAVFQTRADGSAQGSEEQRSARESTGQPGRGCIFASFTGVEMAGVKYRYHNASVVWWSLAATSAPGSSARFSKDNRTKTEMKTAGRMWWKKSIPYSCPPHLIPEVCPSNSWPKPKPPLLADVEKKMVCFPLFLGSSDIFLFTYDHQNAV